MLSPSLSRTGLLRTRLRTEHRYATSAFTLTLQFALFGCPLRARVRVYLGATIAPSSLGGRSNRVPSPLGSILSHDHGPTLVGYGSEIASRRIDPSGSCVPVRKAMHTSAQSLTGHLTGQARPAVTPLVSTDCHQLVSRNHMGTSSDNGHTLGLHTDHQYRFVTT